MKKIFLLIIIVSVIGVLPYTATATLLKNGIDLANANTLIVNNAESDDSSSEFSATAGEGGGAATVGGGVAATAGEGGGAATVGGGVAATASEEGGEAATAGGGGANQPSPYGEVSEDLIFSGDMGTKGGLEEAKTGLEGTGVSTEDSIIVLTLRWVNFALSFAGVLAFLAFVYAGFLYVANFGNEDMTSKAKTIMFGAVGGLILIFSAFAIVSTIIGASA